MYSNRSNWKPDGCMVANNETSTHMREEKKYFSSLKYRKKQKAVFIHRVSFGANQSPN
jgi:hypothetical protein